MTRAEKPPFVIAEVTNVFRPKRSRPHLGTEYAESDDRDHHELLWKLMPWARQAVYAR